MGPEHQESLKQPVPQFVVIDFDRTMGNTNTIMSRLYGVAEAFGINTKSIFDKQEALEKQKRSFDPLPYIKEALGNDKARIEAFKEQFISATDPPIMYEDVQPFLKMLHQNNIQYGVLTYGVSKEWQEWKIAASSYTGRKLTIDHEDKGAEVGNWQTTTGVYEINDDEHDAILAATVCIIDDKKKAFKGLPENAVGFWLQRPDATDSSRSGELPQNREIEVIHSLEELTVNNQRLVKKVVSAPGI
jgi:hypothetical protein